ncbi:Hypothetical protein CINCED_3A018320 [Cinara cedri]|uniref:Major facilitator superfamily (MFS) profile domain-containing protein n=1 Tax=Cinara cedri TaxID=506608 RepID=A0A5E4MJZ6_9HEMI|nr:Hypothetical protein CINCED_3A018320 [Cinara cedri]
MNIDDVLIILGMGRYQFVYCLLFGLMIMYSNVSPVAYVFTAGDLKYRCVIPECDPVNPTDRTYEPDWLRFTTPYKADTELPNKCKRYALRRTGNNGTLCAPEEFDRSEIDKCWGNWVFEEPVNTIGTEFKLMCEENKWKLSMVGSVNNFGQFIGIPISGIIADRFGRKFAMIFCAATSAALSIAQSFSINYTMFWFLELLSSSISSGIYTVTFVLGMESVLPKKRVIYFSILECFYPLGAIIVAYIASQAKDWKLLLRISNVPGLLFLSLTEESMRWSQTQGHQDNVLKTLKKIAVMNKKTLPELNLDMQTETSVNHDDGDGGVKYTSILKVIFHSPTITWRMVRCSFIWVAITLVYYGLTINATDIAGNKYLNFALASFVEIPGCLINWLVMEGMTRKMSLSCMFILSGAMSVVYNLTPDNLFLVKLSLFMFSKVAISVAFSIIYILTAEIFPTWMRATALSMCSMIGRVGSMLAPQTTLLGEYFGNYMIMLVFGVVSLIAATITMTLPESKNIKLPDTIDEAEQIGVRDHLTPKNNETSA